MNILEDIVALSLGLAIGLFIHVTFSTVSVIFRLFIVVIVAELLDMGDHDTSDHHIYFRIGLFYAQAPIELMILN